MITTEEWDDMTDTEIRKEICRFVTKNRDRMGCDGLRCSECPLRKVVDVV